MRIDLSNLIHQKQELQPQPPEQQYTKEEYAALKQAEREEVWSSVNAQAESVFKDDASMRGFLHFMADCTPQKTSNLLLLYAQNPEITHPRTFDKWKEAGRSIRSGEKGYTFYGRFRNIPKRMAPEGSAPPSPRPTTSLRPEDRSPLPPSSICPKRLSPP